MANDTNQKKAASKGVVAAVGLAATLMATALPIQAAPVGERADESLISEIRRSEATIPDAAEQAPFLWDFGIICFCLRSH